MLFRGAGAGLCSGGSPQHSSGFDHPHARVAIRPALGSRGEISGIVAVNLVGAMLGGLLEYNSMYLGFRALYLMAMVLYALAFVWDLPHGKTRKVAELQTPASPPQSCWKLRNSRPLCRWGLSADRPSFSRMGRPPPQTEKTNSSYSIFLAAIIPASIFPAASLPTRQSGWRRSSASNCL